MTNQFPVADTVVPGIKAVLFPADAAGERIQVFRFQKIPEGPGGEAQHQGHGVLVQGKGGMAHRGVDEDQVILMQDIHGTAAAVFGAALEHDVQLIFLFVSVVAEIHDLVGIAGEPQPIPRLLSAKPTSAIS